MKKSLLILLSVLGFSLGSMHLYAQNLQAHNISYDDQGANIDAHVTIVNTGVTTISIVVQRTVHYLASGHSTLFCWSLCYSPATDYAPDPIDIGPGDSSTVFKGTMNSFGYPGGDEVAYRFFDVNNPADSVSVTFNYTFAVGINDPVSKPTVSGAYPNPANSLTNISYNLNSAKEGRIVFYNMLGSAVKEIVINDRQNTIIVSTADLKAGIYFYSLVADGKVMSSKKLIVAHP